MKDNRVTHQPLMQCVERTRQVAACVKSGQYAEAMALRGRGFASALRTLRTIVRALPHPPAEGQSASASRSCTAAALPRHDTAVRAACASPRPGPPRPGVRNGFKGLVEGDFFDMGWMSVNGWASRGGRSSARTAASPRPRALPGGPSHREARDRRDPDGGRWSGYSAIGKLHAERERFPAFTCDDLLPASINNTSPPRSSRSGATPPQQHRGGGQDQDVGGGVAALLRGRVMGGAAGTSPPERPRPGRAGLHARGRRHPRRPAARLQMLTDGFRQGKRLGS